MMKPGIPKLSEVARKVVAPEGIVSTEWPAVRATCRDKLGLSFDPWQDQSGRLALAKRGDGTYAATIGGIGMSICRQAGKTHWMTGLSFGLCINRPNTLGIWSAHHAKTHGETFLTMSGFAERQRVDPYIDQVFKGSGDEEIRFRNGSRILFGAREHGFGRGIPGVDFIVADEAQIMSERAVDAMTATMNTSDVGLMFTIGTPPRPEDRSEFFTRMRDEAWSGEMTDSVWIEFGAEPGDDPDNPETWTRANPSYPTRTPRESMLRLKKKLTADSFIREGLGIWDPKDSGTAVRPAIWEANAIEDPNVTTTVSFGVHTNLERTRSVIAAATALVDGGILIELVPAEQGKNFSTLPGTSWLPPRLRQLAADHRPVAIVMHGRSSTTAVIPDLEELGVETLTTTSRSMADACAQTFDALTEGRLKHLNQSELTESALAATWKAMGESRVWDWKNDITAWTAATLAVHGLIVHGGEPKETEVWGFFS